jgi:hypothetical protein
MQYLISQEKKNPANSPQYFILLKTNAIWKENIICMARSNLMMPIQKKNRRSTYFFCSQTVPTMLSQENRGHNKLVPRLHSKHTNITSKCASKSNLMP